MTSVAYLPVVLFVWSICMFPLHYNWPN